MHKHSTPVNIHTEVAWSSLNNIVRTLLKFFYCTETYCMFSILSFVRPNWLHVRSSLVPGLTYDRLIEKNYLQACKLCLNDLHDNCFFSKIFESPEMAALYNVVMQFTEYAAPRHLSCRLNYQRMHI